MSVFSAEDHAAAQDGFLGIFLSVLLLGVLIVSSAAYLQPEDLTTSRAVVLDASFRMVMPLDDAA